MTSQLCRASMVFAMALAFPSLAHAQRAPLPAPLVALESDQGQTMASESNAKSDFFHLANSWESQQLGSFCGVASTVMVLNALQIPAPAVEAWGAYHSFTQGNVFDGASLTASQVSRGGMTLDQLGAFIASHGHVQVTVTHAADTTLDAFRAAAMADLAEAGNYIVVNYDRAGVGQETMGHISPLGAYHAASDRFLVMDVARYKYPAVWVSAASLFAAMNTTDPVTSRSRGFVAVRFAPGEHARVGPPAKSGLPRFVVIVLLAVFAVGVLVGSSVTLFVKRRR